MKLKLTYFRTIIDNKFNIGLLMIMMCLPFTNILRAIINRNINNISEVIMFLGLLLLIDYKQLVKMRFYIKGVNFIVCFIFVLYTLIRALFSNNDYQAGNPIYVLFTIVIMIAISTNKSWNKREEYLKILFYTSGILAIICALFFTKGFSSFTQGFNGIYDSNGVLIADRITMSGIPFTCFMTCLAYKIKRKHEFGIKIVFGIFAVICLLVVNRRALFVSLIISVLFIFLKKIKKNYYKKEIYTFFCIILAACLLFCILIRVEFFHDNLERLITFTQRGFTTLLGSTKYGLDVSAHTRLILRNNVLSEYKTYSFIEILFGKGYMYQYLDFPLLQAFIDLGITGGLIYIYLQLVLPISIIIKRYNDDIGLYLQLSLLYLLMNIFYVGIPYGYSAYLSLILSLFYIKDISNNKNTSI